MRWIDIFRAADNLSIKINEFDSLNSGRLMTVLAVDLYKDWHSTPNVKKNLTNNSEKQL